MNILVPTDDSPAGLRALRWATGFSARTGSDVQAVRAWAYPHLPGDGLDDPETMDRRVRQDLREAVAAVAPPGATIETKVLRGPAGPSLLSLIERETPSLVIMGRRGPETPHTLLGSVSRRLVEQAHVPVVVVSGDDELADFSLGRIVVGVDGSSHATRALEWAAELATTVGARLLLVNAVGIDPEAPTNLSERFEASTAVLEDHAAQARARGVEVETMSIAGDARLVVESVADQHDADLIVVGTRGLGKLGKLLLGTVAGYLAQHVNRPVAVIPPTRPTAQTEHPIS